MCPLLSRSLLVRPNRRLISLLFHSGKFILDQIRRCRIPCRKERFGRSGHGVLWMRLRNSGYLGPKFSEHTGGHRGPL